MSHALRAAVRLLLLIAAAYGSAARAQQTDVRVRQILADWEKRQGAVKAVQYEVKGQRITPKGSMRDNSGKLLQPPAPSEDIADDIRWTVTLDFENGRHRREVSEQVFSFETKRTRPKFTVDVCNGKILKSANPRDKNTTESYSPPPTRSDLIIMSGNLRAVAFEPEYMPLFFAHGIVRTMMAEVVPGKLRSKPDPEYFHYHGEGVHRGRKCAVVRTQTLKLGTTSFEEFWVDPARQSAIVRYVMYSGKSIFGDIDIEYQQTPHGWLPEQWTFTNRYGSGPPGLTWRMRVEGLQTNLALADSDFDLPSAPGMRVEEVEFGDTLHPLAMPKQAARVYQIDERGGRTEVPDMFHRPRSLEEPKGRWKWALLAALVVCLIAGGAFLVARIRRRRATSEKTGGAAGA